MTGSDALSVLREINDTDKHRIVPIVTTATRFREVRIKCTIIPLAQIKKFDTPLPHNVRVEEGAEIARFPLGQLPKGHKVYVQATFDGRFVFGDKPPIAKGRIIVDAIEEIIRQVQHVIDSLAPTLKWFIQ